MFEMGHIGMANSGLQTADQIAGKFENNASSMDRNAAVFGESVR